MVSKNDIEKEWDYIDVMLNEYLKSESNDEDKSIDDE